MWRKKVKEGRGQNRTMDGKRGEKSNKKMLVSCVINAIWRSYIFSSFECGLSS